mmetsp:Transcript_21842/g.61853  ORF Transcript_21842/g.61853 Transcript_21842/m.61853 type:complete len:256 (+) Transcript_21842:140-907(+)
MALPPSRPAAARPAPVPLAIPAAGTAPVPLVLAAPRPVALAVILFLLIVQLLPVRGASHGRHVLRLGHLLPLSEILQHEHHQRGWLVRPLQVLRQLVHVILRVVSLGQHLGQLGGCMSVQEVLSSEIRDLPLRGGEAAEHALLHLTHLHHQEPGGVPRAGEDLPQCLHVLLERFLSRLHLLVQSPCGPVVEVEVASHLHDLGVYTARHDLLVLLGGLAREVRRELRVLVHQHGLQLLVGRVAAGDRRQARRQARR